MTRKYAAILALAMLLVAPSSGMQAGMQAQDGKAVVSAAAKAMGAENLKTLQLSASGSNAGIGQNLNPSMAWPMVPVISYNRQIDFDAAASGVQLVRRQNNVEQPQTQLISSTSPWVQQFDLWITPYGFLKAAMAGNVTLRSETVVGVKYNVVGVTLQDKYKVEGYINEQNIVGRVRTWIDNDVLGDLPVEAVYSDYKDFGGLKVPTFVMVKQGGYPTLILGISDVKANVPVTIQAPPAPAAAATVVVNSEKIADGVFYLKGGTHHSVAVEFADHIALIEGPQNEQRSLAVLDELKKLFPNKPLRYVINTHHHFDHSGGLRTYVDAGATIVTHEINKTFYEKAFVAPRTLNPDKLEQSKRKATIETVDGDKKVMMDALRTLELHLVGGNAHNTGILMAFLPKEKLLIEVDLYTPPAAGAAAPAPAAVANATSLVNSVERLRLDYETILPLHGPGKVTRADLYAFVKKPMTAISELPDPNARAAAPTGPDAAMQQLLNTACTRCHNLDRVNNKQGDKDAWTTTVTRMKGNGAEITDAQLPQLADFLFRTRSQ